MATWIRTKDGVQYLLPDAPRCVACGHFVCPMCREWCDVLVPVAGDPDGDLDACDCDALGGCTYDSDYHARWFEVWDRFDVASCREGVDETDVEFAGLVPLGL